MFWCLYCLNLAHNAAWPLRVRWTQYVGPDKPREHKEQEIHGTEQAANVFADRFADPASDANIVLFDGGLIANPLAVTLADGAACCAYHADPSRRAGGVSGARRY